MDLSTIRERIDQIDREMVDLLSRRMELSVRTRGFKKEITDSSRENEIFANTRRLAIGLLSPDFTQALYQSILAEAKKLQELPHALIAFQGEHGAYSEIAVRSYNGSAAAIPHAEFNEVFESVASGAVDLGVVPVENSLGGNVTQVDDLLIETELKIVGEVQLPVHHCLISLPNSDYRELRVVYSHPQALSQCRGFLARTKLEARPYYDTAGAARMLGHERPAATAVLASSLCAEMYGLEILKENVEDSGSNATRFLVLGRESSGSAGDKCSIVFSTAHKPGALFSLLSAFSEAGINLTRIESRPMPKQPGAYAFLLDFLGAEDDPAVKKALDRVKAEAQMFKFLGCYKRAVL